MARREFSEKTKIAAFNRAGGKCEVCFTTIHSGAQYDHIIEEYLTHDNSLENCKVLCAKCHGVKTQKSRPEIDKTRRILKKRANVKHGRFRKPPPGMKYDWKQGRYRKDDD